MDFCLVSLSPSFIPGMSATMTDSGIFFQRIFTETAESLKPSVPFSLIMTLRKSALRPSYCHTENLHYPVMLFWSCGSCAQNKSSLRCRLTLEHNPGQRSSSHDALSDRETSFTFLEFTSMSGSDFESSWIKLYSTGRRLSKWATEKMQSKPETVEKNCDHSLPSTQARPSFVCRVPQRQPCQSAE